MEWIMNMHNDDYKYRRPPRKVKKGPPKATESFSVADLEELEMIGIYQAKEESKP